MRLKVFLFCLLVLVSSDQRNKHVLLHLVAGVHGSNAVWAGAAAIFILEDGSIIFL
jgi:hypothetical protein